MRGKMMPDIQGALKNMYTIGNIKNFALSYCMISVSNLDSKECPWVFLADQVWRSRHWISEIERSKCSVEIVNTFLLKHPVIIYVYICCFWHRLSGKALVYSYTFATLYFIQFSKSSKLQHCETTIISLIQLATIEMTCMKC